MASRSFKGGIHPNYSKEFSASRVIEKLPLPERVIIPLQQHIGAPCEPLVKVGDSVKVGQKIAEANAYVSAPIHATISGKVTAIGSFPHPSGKHTKAIIIDGDGQDEAAFDITAKADYKQLEPQKIVEIIREAGIVGLGGAAFPTHVKLNPPADKKIDTVILNGCECEPYLTTDHRIMVEKPENVIEGLLIVMKAVNAQKGFIGVEENKPDAIEALRKVIVGDNNIQVTPLKIKYPQGAEKQLIYATLKKSIAPGKLPLDVGVVVNNVGTAAAIAQVFKTGMPLIERVITVTGSVIKEPKNLLVRIGTPVEKLLEACGGFAEEPAKVIIGGPMTGTAQYTLSIPVVKGTSGIVAFSKTELTTQKVSDCIKCAKCVDVCPMGLLPNFLCDYAEKGIFTEAEKYRVMDCVECGSCAFVCPSRRYIVQAIRMAKGGIMAKRNKK